MTKLLKNANIAELKKIYESNEKLRELLYNRCIENENLYIDEILICFANSISIVFLAVIHMVTI